MISIDGAAFGAELTAFEEAIAFGTRKFNLSLVTVTCAKKQRVKWVLNILNIEFW